MLKFLVYETLAGRADTLKGYTIGLSVFGRDEDFDPQADPIVRLEARRLRHDLDSYYIAEGAGNPIRISIPKGQYAPRFHDQRQDPASLAPEGGNTDADTTPSDALVIPAQKETGRRYQQLPWAIAALATVVAILALAGCLFLFLSGDTPARPDASAPSVMVLPFEVASVDPKEQLLAAGISDQIMTALSLFPDFKIYLPPSQDLSSGRIDPIEVGRAEGISFVISGSVGSDRGRIRVNARLVHAETKRVLWSGSYYRARNAGTLLDIEHDIAGEIAGIAGQAYGVIKTQLAQALPRVDAAGKDSFECVLRGYVYRRNFSNELYPVVRGCLEEAVRRDPGYAEAWAMLGWIYLDGARFGIGQEGNPELAYDRALDAASHALTLDAGNVLGLKAMSSINHYMGNVAEGERFARKALELNPYDPDAQAQLGWRLAAVGKMGEGIPLLQQAIERTSNAPGWYFHMIAIDHLLNGRYPEMLTAAKKGTVDGSSISWCLVAIAQAELGNPAPAELALRKVAEISPELYADPAKVLRSHQVEEKTIDALLTGLKKAGWSAPPNG